jgi:hypothetical protein
MPFIAFCFSDINFCFALNSSTLPPVHELFKRPSQLLCNPKKGSFKTIVTQTLTMVMEIMPLLRYPHRYWCNSHCLPLHNSGTLLPVHELFKRPSYSWNFVLNLIFKYYLHRKIKNVRGMPYFVLYFRILSWILINILQKWFSVTYILLLQWVFLLTLLQTLVTWHLHLVFPAFILNPFLYMLVTYLLHYSLWYCGFVLNIDISSICKYLIQFQPFLIVFSSPGNIQVRNLKNGMPQNWSSFIANEVQMKPLLSSVIRICIILFQTRE